MEGRRYTVEMQDEYGSCDFDYFEAASDAIECAAAMDASACARVIDRQEQAVIWSYEAAEKSA